MSKKLQLLLITLATFASPSTAQFSSSPGKAWTAQWITIANAAQRDEIVLHFRKTIELRARPEHFLIDVSADNQFTFYANEERVGSGPSRGDLGHWRFETYDIAPYLHAGKNLLGATVWNFGTHAAIAQISDRVAFLVHGESDAERMADTDASWEVEQEKGIQSIPPQVPGYYAAEPGERWDAAVLDLMWNSGSRLGNRWPKAQVVSPASERGETDSHNNWQLVRDPLPAMEMKLISAGKRVRVTGFDPGKFPEREVIIPGHTTGAILLDSSQLITAYPALTVSGGAGSNIRLTYAEALVDANGNKGNRNQIEEKHIVGINDEFLPSGCDSCEFMPLTWRTWRYLQIDVQTGEQPLRLKKLAAWFTAFPFEARARFQSDEMFLSAIWDVGWRTARLDAHDTYMDTPYWERLQYIGDTRIQALISYVVAGDDRLARQAIEAFNNSRIPDGLTQSRYPSALVQMIPTFSLMWVGMVHDFWMYRGDRDFVGAQLPGARAVLDWYLRHQRSDGMLEKLPWWPFVDWGKDFDFGMPPQDEDGGSTIVTLQFVEALRYAAELESALGDKNLAERYRSAATRAIQAVWKLCWNQEYGLLADTPRQKHFSQHANILGIWLDVIPSVQQKNVLERILSNTDSSFKATGVLPEMTAATYYFRFYLSRALEHGGMGERYLELLGPWKQMLSLGLSTWAESPEPTRSDSHAWSAHPNYDLLTIVAGIHAQTAGFQTVMIAPCLGALEHVSAAIPTPRGMVEVEYSRVGDGLHAHITLPPATSGQIVWRNARRDLHAGEQELLVH